MLLLGPSCQKQAFLLVSACLQFTGTSSLEAQLKDESRFRFLALCGCLAPFFPLPTPPPPLRIFPEQLSGALDERGGEAKLRVSGDATEALKAAFKATEKALPNEDEVSMGVNTVSGMGACTCMHW